MVTIYGLRNTVTGSVYVGCTKGPVSKRMREHRCLLRGDKHQCKLLQASWNHFKGAVFEAVVLEELPHNTTTEVKRSRELYWIEQFRGVGLLYNEHGISFQPPNGAQKKAAAARVANGYRPSAESNLKRRLAQLGKPKGHGAKISATKRARKERRDSLNTQE